MLHNSYLSSHRQLEVLQKLVKEALSFSRQKQHFEIDC